MDEKRRVCGIADGGVGRVKGQDGESSNDARAIDFVNMFVILNSLFFLGRQVVTMITRRSGFVDRCR